MKRIAAIACLLFSFSTFAEQRPNIVFIMADDLGYGDLSCYGSTTINTPNIDALADKGIRFIDYHTNGVVCSPTRAALMTGRYPQRTGVEGVITAKSHREVGLPLEEVTIAEVLKGAGYATAMFGKWHLGYDIKKFGPLKQGFDTFEGFVSGNVDYFNKIDQAGHKDWYVGDELKHVEGYVTDIINDRGADWIKAQHAENKDKPFFLYLSHGAPHYPLQGPDDEGFREVGKKVRKMPKDVKGTYKAMIESMDQGIGRVVATIKELGLEDNTLIVFTSDNGPAKFYSGSAGELRGQKGQVFEGGHRVPMIMAGYDWKADALYAQSTLLMTADFFPTFAALAGAKLPEDLVIDGLDLGQFIFMVPPYSSRFLHWQFKDNWAARYGQLKAVTLPDGSVALYAVHEDPGETKDLAKEHPKLVQDMIEEHDRWLKKTREGVTPVSVHPQQ